ncbi:hypothetical protein VNO77_46939 [Canavalia gladiata]|uniref:Uncharacterized protein n=1 Tax=Canavalia gladiata TaxID=3824 RepID=A0AAN9JGL6_CANGL
MKSFGLYINSHCDYDAGFPLWSPFIRYPYDQKNEEISPWSTETAESTINSLSGLDTSVSLLTQAPLPLHDFLMDTLRSIPMDGTFHQLRPFVG